MEAQEACKLRREWFGKTCSHPIVEKEFDRHSDRGNAHFDAGVCVCTTCGSEFGSKDVWEKLRKKLAYEAHSLA